MDIDRQITKSPDWHATRRRGIGGSDASKIMAGAWYDLWEEKTGRKEPKDLSSVLPVAMGCFTEPFNLFWFEKNTSLKVSTEETQTCRHPRYDFLTANLDGRVNFGIFEAKHVNAFTKSEDVRAKYYAQCQHNMQVTGTGFCYLSIFIGSHHWEYFDIIEDPEYQADLLKREIEFWNLVETDTPPDLETPGTCIAPLAIDAMIEVDMAKSNSWCTAAADYLRDKDAAKTFKTAGNTLRGLVEDNVKHAFGAGVAIKRSKDRKLRIEVC